MTKPTLCNLLNIDFPVIMAPMFLVTNKEMVIEACNSGIAGCIPALNFRTIPEVARAMKQRKDNTKSPVGVNIIVNTSNVLAMKHLHACLDNEVDFFITSHDSPEAVIKESKKLGVKVF